MFRVVLYALFKIICVMFIMFCLFIISHCLYFPYFFFLFSYVFPCVSCFISMFFSPIFFSVLNYSSCPSYYNFVSGHFLLIGFIVLGFFCFQLLSTLPLSVLREPTCAHISGSDLDCWILLSASGEELVERAPCGFPFG